MVIAGPGDIPHHAETLFPETRLLDIAAQEASSSWSASSWAMGNNSLAKMGHV